MEDPGIGNINIYSYVNGEKKIGKLIDGFCVPGI
jgi:hypothetical protein